MSRRLNFRVELSERGMSLEKMSNKQPNSRTLHLKHELLQSSRQVVMAMLTESRFNQYGMYWILETMRTGFIQEIGTVDRELTITYKYQEEKSQKTSVMEQITL